MRIEVGGESELGFLGFVYRLRGLDFIVRVRGSFDSYFF